MDLISPENVQGNLFFFTLFLIKKAKRKGINICDIITTQMIPMIDMAAMDLNAGCFANTSTPSPAMVVMAERKMDDL